jgi:hypothetical protein
MPSGVAFDQLGPAERGVVHPSLAGEAADLPRIGPWHDDPETHRCATYSSWLIPSWWMSVAIRRLAWAPALPTSYRMLTDNQRIAAIRWYARPLKQRTKEIVRVRNVLIARAAVAARRAARSFAENASARIAISPARSPGITAGSGRSGSQQRTPAGGRRSRAIEAFASRRQSRPKPLGSSAAAS